MDSAGWLHGWTYDLFYEALTSSLVQVVVIQRYRHSQRAGLYCYTVLGHSRQKNTYTANIGVSLRTPEREPRRSCGHKSPASPPLLLMPGQP